MICRRRYRAFVSAVVLAALSGCEERTVLVQTEPMVVTVSRPVQRDIADYDEYIGRLDAAESVEVRGACAVS